MPDTWSLTDQEEDAKICMVLGSETYGMAINNRWATAPIDLSVYVAVSFERSLSMNSVL